MLSLDLIFHFKYNVGGHANTSYALYNLYFITLFLKLLENLIVIQFSDKHQEILKKTLHLVALYFSKTFKFNFPFLKQKIKDVLQKQEQASCNSCP